MTCGPGLKTRSASTVLAMALALAFVGLTTAVAAERVIGHGARLKATKIFFAQGKAVAPRTISARLAPTPVQPVKVQWSLVCQKPNKADPAIQIGASETLGQTTVTGRATVEMKLPFAKPPTCVATVYATLARNGGLVLRLVQT
jgi:hypothetical protein